MNYIFIPSPSFIKSAKHLAKKYRSLPHDIASFIATFRNNPSMGVDLGHGFRKIRIQIASKNKGKSGGARVITYELLLKDVEDSTHILLVDIYDKSEIENISDERMEAILRDFIAEQE